MHKGVLILIVICDRTISESGGRDDNVSYLSAVEHRSSYSGTKIDPSMVRTPANAS